MLDNARHAQCVLVMAKDLGSNLTLRTTLVGIVPVCTAAGKVYGIDEYLLPTITTLLEEARTVALLRCIRAEAIGSRVRKVFEQMLNAGTQLLRVLGEAPRR